MEEIKITFPTAKLAKEKSVPELGLKYYDGESWSYSVYEETIMFITNKYYAPKAPIIVTTTHNEWNGEHVIAEFDSWEDALEKGLQQGLQLI